MHFDKIELLFRDGLLYTSSLDMFVLKCFPDNSMFYQVQAALDAALQEEGDLHLDASADIFSLKSKKKLKTR